MNFLSGVFIIPVNNSIDHCFRACDLEIYEPLGRKIELSVDSFEEFFKLPDFATIACKYQVYFFQLNKLNLSWLVLAGSEQSVGLKLDLIRFIPHSFRITYSSSHSVANLPMNFPAKDFHILYNQSLL